MTMQRAGTRKAPDVRKNGQGATARRKPKGDRPPLRSFLRRSLQLATLCGVLVGLGTAGYLVKSFLDEAAQRPVNSIGVEGQFAYITQEMISESVTPMIVGGFLQLPLVAIKAELERNPWIAQAAVSRRWPDELYISIVEEQPIARWGEAGFLNHKGEIIEVEVDPRLQSLPLLAGTSGQAKSAMQNYQQLAQLLRPSGLKISEFYSDELFSWNVVLSNGLRINIGRDETMKKMQRFLVVYNRELHKRLDEVAAVDLRYGNGLAVEWKAATADSAETETGEDKKA